jgi:DNA-binding CsgD family transcriptional regulator
VAALEARAGDPARAARLAGAAVELRGGHAPLSGARLAELLGPARKALGEPHAAALLAEGRAMTAAEAVSYAIQPPAGGNGAAPASGSAGPADWAPIPRPRAAASSEVSTLTPRELEIAGLIARGLSNRAIADELVISQATVARHVANMLTKLGFNSRAQVAAWMARQADS